MLNHSLKSSTVEVVAATTLSWLYAFCHDCQFLPSPISLHALGRSHKTVL